MHFWCKHFSHLYFCHCAFWFLKPPRTQGQHMFQKNYPKIVSDHRERRDMRRKKPARQFPPPGAQQNCSQIFAQTEHRHLDRIGRSVSRASTKRTVCKFQFFLQQVKDTKTFNSTIFQQSKQVTKFGKQHKTQIVASICPKKTVPWLKLDEFVFKGSNVQIRRKCARPTLPRKSARAKTRTCTWIFHHVVGSHNTWAFFIRIYPVGVFEGSQNYLNKQLGDFWPPVVKSSCLVVKNIQKFGDFWQLLSMVVLIACYTGTAHSIDNKKRTTLLSLTFWKFITEISSNNI